MKSRKKSRSTVFFSFTFLNSVHDSTLQIIISLPSSKMLLTSVIYCYFTRWSPLICTNILIFQLNMVFLSEAYAVHFRLCSHRLDFFQMKRSFLCKTNSISYQYRIPRSHWSHYFDIDAKFTTVSSSLAFRFHRLHAVSSP